MPFVVLPVNSELFEFNKIIFIYTISALIAGLWLMRSLHEKKLVIKKSPLDIPLILFFSSQVLSTLFSIDQHTSLFGYYGRFNGGLLSTATYIFLYYAFISNIDTQINKVIRNIFGVSIISSILVVLWGLPGKFNHDLSCLLFTSKFDNSCWTAQFRPAERMFSTMGQPNWLGAYLAITFFMSLFLLFTTVSKKIQSVAFLGVVFTFVGILLSRSRSSLASLIPGAVFIGLYIAYLYFKKSSWITTSKKKVALIAMGVLLFLTVIVQTGIPQIDSILTLAFLKKTPQSVPVAVIAPAPKSLEVVGPITESLDIRKIVWQGAWELGQQYPLFGSGVETFGYAYYSVRPQSHNLTSEWDYLYNKAHNEFLNLLATTGWFGLGSYIILMIWACAYIVLSVLKHRADEHTIWFYISLLSIFISICITNFFGFSITVINIYWYVGFAFLVVYNKDQKTFQDEKNKLSLSQVGIALVLTLWLLNSIVTYWIADYSYAQADIALKSNNAGVSVNLLQRALSLREEHVYEDKLSYALSQYAYMASYQKEKDKAIELISVAEKLNLKSIQSSPQNVLYWKTRVKNQFIFYQMSLDKKYLFTGLSALDEATKLAPTDPKIPYFLATYYSLMFDDEKNTKQKELYKTKSIESIDKTITLKSDYGDAYLLKYQLLKKYAMKREAKTLLEWYIPRYGVNNEELKKELSAL